MPRRVGAGVAGIIAALLPIKLTEALRARLGASWNHHE